MTLCHACTFVIDIPESFSPICPPLKLSFHFLYNNKWHIVNINIADSPKFNLLEYHGNTIPMEDTRTYSLTLLNSEMDTLGFICC
jgi:hypothetical protein